MPISIANYPDQTGNLAVIGVKPDGTPCLVACDEDGKLDVGLVFDGTVNVGEVSFSQTAGENTVVVGESALPTGAATQATLAALLAKVISAPATEAKQDTGNGTLSTISGKVATETTLASILAKLTADPATQTTLAALNAKVTAVNTGAVVVSSGTVTANTAVASLSTAGGFASSKVVKAAAGTLFSITGYNSGPAKFLQLHNAASLPADGVTPAMTLAIPAASTFAFEWRLGIPCSTGIVICNSTTAETKAIGLADCLITSTYI